MQLVGGARVACELRLDVGESTRVEQVAELLLAEQLAKEVAIERERLRATLGGRGVVLVHVGGDVREEEGRGERRGAGVLDLDEIELARLEAVQDPLQRREVEHVLQALAVGLEHDRERAVVARHLQQALRLQTLLPERGALARATARDQERAGGVLAEARAEERRLAHLLDDELLDLLGRDQQVRDRRRQRRPPAGGGRSRRPTRSNCASRPSASRRRAPSAIAQGACTRAPKGVRMHTRQSPISSRKRSTTIVRSDGTTPPFAAAWSRR